MNFHVIAGQVESDPFIPKGSNDVQLRVVTKEKNIKTQVVYSTYHSVRIIDGVSFGFNLLSKGAFIAVMGNQQYYTPKDVEVPKGYSYPLIRALPINCFVMDSNGDILQLDKN